MGTLNSNYDFFIAHASKDIDTAIYMYNILAKNHIVFLDKHSLGAGDNWSQILPEALEKSKVIILLLSKDSTNAYYLQEEMLRAIQLNRTKKNWNRLIPVYLDGFPANISDIPYGLYQIHSIDLRDEGSVENICIKIRQYLERSPDSNEDNSKVKEQLSFKHVLHAFPVGPMVDGYLVSTNIIETFAEAIDVSESLQVINQANAFRKSADPFEEGSILIRKIKLPPPAKNTAIEFWLAAFTQARLHGPRMLAALLLTVEDTFFPKQIKEEKNKLLEILKQKS